MSSSSNNNNNDIESAVPPESATAAPSVREDATHWIIPTFKTTSDEPQTSTINKIIAPIGLAIGIAALVVGAVALAKVNDQPTLPSSSTLSSNFGVLNEPVMMDKSTTLDNIQQRGTLNCGIVLAPGFAEEQSTPDSYEGFDVDLCRAVAAGIFGVTDNKDEYIDYTPVTYAERFPTLQSKKVDMLAASTTHTMERDVYIPEIESGLSFSVPYYYFFHAFAGTPDMVACADSMNVSGDCADLKVRYNEVLALI